MRVITKRLDEIRPYPNNPRKNDKAVQYVMNSIKEFGFNVPLVIDKDGYIVAGHTRYEACKKLKIKEVPCVIADQLTEEQAKAFRLADNKTAEIAEWDIDKLEEELNSIFDIDMADFGFELELSDDEEDQDKPEQPFEDVERFERHYGVPYQGNKSRIADIIIRILPEGNRLVDLFGGGGCNYSLRTVIRQMGILFVQRYKPGNHKAVLGCRARQISR